MICGVRVPHTRGFLAHSDGDVGLHALVDAILGALAIVLLEEYLSHWFEFWRLAFGPMLVLSVLFLRNGLAGLLDRRAHA